MGAGDSGRRVGRLHGRRPVHHRGEVNGLHRKEWDRRMMIIEDTSPGRSDCSHTKKQVVWYSSVVE